MIREPAESFSVRSELFVFAAEFLDGLGNDIGPVSGMVQQAVAFRGEPRVRTEDKPLTAKVPDHFLLQGFNDFCSFWFPGNREKARGIPSPSVNSPI